AVYTFKLERFRANTVSKIWTNAPPGFYYPGDAGFKHVTGLCHRLDEDRRDGRADAGRAPAVRSQAQEGAVQPGLDESARPGSTHHEEEGWPHALGLQSRARHGSGNRRSGGCDGATRRSRRYHEHDLDADRSR